VIHKFLVLKLNFCAAFRHFLINPLDLIISPAFAEGEATTLTGAGLSDLVPLMLLFVVFYFLLIRPQQKRAKEHKALLATLKKDDEVVTNDKGVFWARIVIHKFLVLKLNFCAAFRHFLINPLLLHFNNDIISNFNQCKRFVHRLYYANHATISHNFIIFF
jgi:preprotein translocase subunit YajC